VSKYYCKLVLLLAVLLYPFYSFSLDCKRIKGGFSAYELGATAHLEHLKYAPLADGRILKAAGWNSKLDDGNSNRKFKFSGIPIWVAYHLQKYGYKEQKNFVASVNFTRPNPWYRSQTFDIERAIFGFKRKLHDSYSGSGYDRGHMAMRSHMSRVSSEAGCNSHRFENALPQIPKLNRGIWLNLEYTSGALANKYGNIWVVSGPVLSNEPKYIGKISKRETPVAVPDSIFKVIFIENEEDTVEYVAFIFPNIFQKEYKNGQCYKDKVYSLQKFRVNLEELESRTNLRFLENQVQGNYLSSLSKITQANIVWKVESEFYPKGRNCNT